MRISSWDINLHYKLVCVFCAKEKQYRRNPSNGSDCFSVVSLAPSRAVDVVVVVVILPKAKWLYLKFVFAWECVVVVKKILQHRFKKKCVFRALLVFRTTDFRFVGMLFGCVSAPVFFVLILIQNIWRLWLMTWSSSWRKETSCLSHSHGRFKGQRWQWCGQCSHSIFSPRKVNCHEQLQSNTKIKAIFRFLPFLIEFPFEFHLSFVEFTFPITKMIANDIVVHARRCIIMAIDFYIWCTRKRMNTVWRF